MDDLKKRAVDFINLTKDSTWFFDWSSKIDLSDALERKELRTTVLMCYNAREHCHIAKDS